MELAAGDIIKLKSAITTKYVRCINEFQPLKGYLSADGEDGMNQPTEFKLEPASAKNGMWHVKCCGTNKYLQVKNAEPTNTSWIIADADARNEDQGVLACTLFVIEYFGTGPTTTMRLRHRFLQRYACLYKANDTYPYCLCAFDGQTNKDSKDVFVCVQS